MKPLRHAAAAIIIALIALPAPMQAQTNGFVMHCLSARAAGQGCVTRAREDIPTDLFRDPAAASWFTRPALEINLSAMIPALTFTNSANARTDGALHAYPLASAAFVRPRISPRLSWALGMEPIGGFGSDFRLQHQLLGPGQNYESFFAAMKMGSVIAVEVAPRLSLGAGGYATYGQIRQFRMPFTMSPSVAAGMGPLMQLDPHYPALFSGVTELTAYGSSSGFAGWGWGATLGFAWKPVDELRLSGSWMPRSRISLGGGKATMDMSKQFEAMFGMMVQERMTNHGATATEAQTFVAQALTQAGMNLSLGTIGTYHAETELSEPQTAGFGVSFDPSPRWNVALEGVWMDWSSAEWTMPFVLTQGDNANVNILINANPGNGDFTYPFPLHWRDSWSGRGGVAYEATDKLTLRGGYLYGRNPVPDDAVFVAFPAISSQAVTGGIGMALRNVTIDLSLVHALNATEWGSTGYHFMGSEYRSSRTTMDQNVLTIGATWKY